MSFLLSHNCDQTLDNLSVRHSAILVFTYWHATPHLETDFEIILSLLKRSISVYHIDLTETLSVKTCTHPDTNIYRHSIHNIFSSYPNYHFLTSCRELPPHTQSINYINSILDIEDLDSIEYHDIIIGPCIKSYVIDQLRTATPSLLEAKSLAQESFITAQHVIDTFEYYAIHHDVSALVVFNGRYPAAWAARQYFLFHGLKVYYHERGSKVTEYQLLDHMPHDYHSWVRGYQYLETTFTSLSSSQISLAETWIINKINKQDTQSVNFGLHTVSGLIDSILDPKYKVIISYFTVSFDE